MAKYNVSVTVNDGNAFAIIGAVSRGLKRAGHADAAEEFTKAAMNCSDYDELLRLAMDTVDLGV